MRYVTDFSSQSFGYYVSIIYCSRSAFHLGQQKTDSIVVKGVELLTVEFSSYDSADGFMSVMIGLLFFGTVYALEKVGGSNMFKPWIRSVLGDYAYPVRWVHSSRRDGADPSRSPPFLNRIFSYSGTLKRIDIRTLEHTRAFYPTVDRP